VYRFQCQDDFVSSRNQNTGTGDWGKESETHASTALFLLHNNLGIIFIIKVFPFLIAPASILFVSNPILLCSVQVTFVLEVLCQNSNDTRWTQTVLCQVTIWNIFSAFIVTVMSCCCPTNNLFQSHSQTCWLLERAIELLLQIKYSKPFLFYKFQVAQTGSIHVYEWIRMTLSPQCLAFGNWQL